MILTGSLLVIILIFISTICFAENEKISVDDVQKAESIDQLRKFLGIDDWVIKRTILEKLDQFEYEYEKAEILYLLYVQEETEKNNAIQHVGGLPPRHTRFQIKVLSKLASLPVEKTRERVLDILRAYLTSVEGMDYQKWRVSPKQALQTHMASLLGTYISDEDIREMTRHYLQSRVIKEYAKARLVVPLLEYQLSKVSEGEDPDYIKRIEMILEMATEPGLPNMLYGPKRLYGCAEIMEKVFQNDMSKLDMFMKTGTELSQSAKYFLHFFIVRYSFEKLKSDLVLSNEEMDRLKKAVDFWAEIYPTVIVKQKYASYPLSKLVSEIEKKIDNPALKKTISECMIQTVTKE